MVIVVCGSAGRGPGPKYRVQVQLEPSARPVSTKLIAPFMSRTRSMRDLPKGRRLSPANSPAIGPEKRSQSAGDCAMVMKGDAAGAAEMLMTPSAILA